MSFDRCCLLLGSGLLLLRRCLLGSDSADFRVSVDFEDNTSRLEVVEDVVVDSVDSVHLLVVKNGVGRATFALGHAVGDLGLVLEDIVDEDIFAQVVWETRRIVDLHLEENLFVEELLGLFNEEIVVRLTIALQIARPVAALQDACLTARDVRGCREDRWLLVQLDCIA